MPPFGAFKNVRKFQFCCISLFIRKPIFYSYTVSRYNIWSGKYEINEHNKKKLFRLNK